MFHNFHGPSWLGILGVFAFMSFFIVLSIRLYGGKNKKFYDQFSDFPLRDSNEKEKFHVQ